MAKWNIPPDSHFIENTKPDWVAMETVEQAKIRAFLAFSRGFILGLNLCLIAYLIFGV